MPATQRKVLLLVSGMSPQIITETLYALTQATEPWVPNEIHLITTLQGRDNAILQLLEDKKRFTQFLSDYKVTQPIRFDESTIHLIQDKSGKALTDLRTPEDNEAAADTISGIIRHFTQDNSTELHVSLAGGRKTMGFYAGYALSLFGRLQDQLSHVLVSENYESNQEFYYPTPKKKEITLRDGRSLDASKAKVWLARIPFVRLRNCLPEALLEGTHSFGETVQLAREATEKVTLSLQPQKLSYSVNGRTGKLSSLHMALLLWAAEHGPVEPVVDGEKRDASELLHVAEKYWLNLDGRTEKSLSTGITKQWLEPNISKLRKEMEKKLGLDLTERCKLASRHVNGKRGYALPEDLSIHIEE